MSEPTRQQGIALRLSVAVSFGAALIACERAPSPPPASAQTPRTAERQPVIAAQRRSAIVEAAQRVSPAVVSVTVVKRERQMSMDPFSFFGAPRGFEREVQGLGTGFFITRDGVVITNQHVTDGAEKIVVTTPDGREYSARLLGEDDLTDIAVVKIDATGLPTVPIGRSDDLMIGEWVIAFGNPYGYLLGNAEPTVTAGVVSAVGRNLYPSSDQPGVYVGMIQTDAAINPGNSGGPLVNALGEVVGVNSSIFSNTGGSEGIGFAIPVERAIRVAEELRKFGRVRRAWVGLNVAGDGPRRSIGQSGLPVSSVAAGSPAARSGVQAGDTLVSAQGHRLKNVLDWEGVKLDIGVGDTLAVVIRRKGAERKLVLSVEDLPTSKSQKVAVLRDLQVVSVTPEVRAERGISSKGGALIYQIGPESQEATGLEIGDVIIQVNRQPIGSADDLKRAFQTPRAGSAMRVYVERRGQTLISEFYVR